MSSIIQPLQSNRCNRNYLKSKLRGEEIPEVKAIVNSFVEENIGADIYSRAQCKKLIKKLLAKLKGQLEDMKKNGEVDYFKIDKNFILNEDNIVIKLDLKSAHESYSKTIDIRLDIDK